MEAQNIMLIFLVKLLIIDQALPSHGRWYICFEDLVNFFPLENYFLLCTDFVQHSSKEIVLP